MKNCDVCSQRISTEAIWCPTCGHPNKSSSFDVPMKRRVVTGLLALFLGGLGFHKFYLGKSKVGLLFLVFVWTLIPSIIALVQGIYYMLQSDESFLRAQGLSPSNSTYVSNATYDAKADAKGVF